MVTGMATSKITVTLPDDQLEEIRALVASGGAASVPRSSNTPLGSRFSMPWMARNVERCAAANRGPADERRTQMGGRNSGPAIPKAIAKAEERRVSGITFGTGAWRCSTGTPSCTHSHRVPWNVMRFDSSNGAGTGYSSSLQAGSPLPHNSTDRHGPGRAGAARTQPPSACYSHEAARPTLSMPT